jgi:hypothetical protein
MAVLGKLTTEVKGLLNHQNILWMVKSEDHEFDQYIIGLLENLSSVKKVSFETVLDKEFIETTTIFLSSPYDHENLKEKLILLKSKSTVQKYIFLIDDHFTQHLLDLKINANILYLSEKIEAFGFDVLLKLLSNNFPEILKETKKATLEKIFQEMPSVSKLLFFIESNIGGDFKSFNELFDHAHWKKNYASLLDQKGKTYVRLLTQRFPEEILESFFRAFIFVNNHKIHFNHLSEEEITANSNLSKEVITELINISISTEFKLISKEEERYSICIKDYLKEWQDFKSWAEQEANALNHFIQLEAMAVSFFNGSGTLLSKEQIENALFLKRDNETITNWVKKYKLDLTSIKSYILLSETSLEESLKAARMKRSRLLRNSIRLSIVVSIAFILSTFTALVAYLERNSAVKQQELAIKAKEEAEIAQQVAEIERQQAIEARQKELTALEKAEVERVIALMAKGEAEKERLNALFSLDLAKKSEIEASKAKEVAENNEVVATQAKEIATINFEKSENLRKQQEARSEALQALGLFANGNITAGRTLAQNAYLKNINSGGQWFQPDIVYALITGKIQTSEHLLPLDFEHPIKNIMMSANQELFAVYTINGEIKIYQNHPIKELFARKIGFAKSVQFIGDKTLSYIDLNGKFSFFNVYSTPDAIFSSLGSTKKYEQVFKLSHLGDTLGLGHKEGIEIFINRNNQLTKLTEIQANQVKAIFNDQEHWVWAERNKLYKTKKDTNAKELLMTSNSPITKITKSSIKGCWIIGDESGMIHFVSEKTPKGHEQFAIHSSQVSQLVTFPHDKETEILISSGYDGKLFMYFLNGGIPSSACISSRISLGGHKSWITDFTIDSKNKLALTAGNDRMLRFWPLTISQMIQ